MKPRFTAACSFFPNSAVNRCIIQGIQFRLIKILTHLFQLSPAYLNTNSTSHTWAFSAVAELIGRSDHCCIRK